MFDFSCDDSIVCSWCEPYKRLEWNIRKLFRDRTSFNRKLDEISNAINDSVHKRRPVQWKRALGPFAVFELLSLDGSVEQKFEVQKIILKFFGVLCDENLMAFPTIAPPKYNYHDLLLLDSATDEILNWVCNYYAPISNSKLFDECPLSSDFKRTFTSWLFMISPETYVGLDAWAIDFIKQTPNYLDHHSDPISVEYEDVISGAFSWDRYMQFVQAMEERIGNSSIVMKEYFAYAAYQFARRCFLERGCETA